MTELVHIEVAYATPSSQKIMALDVEKNTTARQAILVSGVEKFYPEVDVSTASLGIFGNALGSRGLPSAEDYVLKEGDRIEIYRPLIADPKEVRKKRAAEAAVRRKEEKAAKSGKPDSSSCG